MREAEGNSTRPDGEVSDHWLDRMFRLEAPRLARFIRGAVSNQDEVHDLVQDTFVKLVASPPPTPPRTPGSYLRQVVRGLLWERRHRAPLRDRVVHLPIEEAFDLASAPEQEWMIEAEDFMRRYEQALAELPAMTREVFRLSRQGELTYKEISEQLDITERAVRYHFKKAIRYLDDRMNADG